MRKINTRSFVRATRWTPREINLQILLNLVREHEPISRAELARRMKIGRGMVTYLTAELIAQGALSGLLGPHDYTVAAYNVFRGPGNYASGDRSGRENVANLFLSLGLDAAGALIETSVELRHWMQSVYPTGEETGASRSQSSRLATFGLRTRIGVGAMHVYPSAGYTAFGRLAVVDADGRPAQADISGFKAQLAIRIAP